MNDDQAGTGATTAVLVDTLLDLEVDVDQVLQMTTDEKVAAVSAAAARGDLSQAKVESLRGFGIPI
ncbi:hypothetical protein DVA67_007255 [Solirubrobacter sp. CPCC 204708]|uniref:Uncharacterized protein n=1 Tax=Solirubrobacter deserti TaxID=2282478 RepID=A0ABT4RKT6_9ACTN|nr:hypothetical protein [Solirubrobacter deserti]MBE2315767.1 hypothetical protein [Solirubrobacter deserti]MDA0138895.1 hypothetical protein [Solirubrobacter deserti]